MLFNSYTFIFIYLPVVLVVFHYFGSRGNVRISIAWLVAASLFFYGWWNPKYLGLILGSIFFNYAVGSLLCNSKNTKILTIGIVINLAFLGYFKYTNFFIENINSIFYLNLQIETIILPLAISFFTFQQISYLVDAYKGETREYNFLHYCLFVTFFPQLIAGPIVHHKEMLPQFLVKNNLSVKIDNISIGVSIFAIGLFKKVVLADSISLYATPVFDAAESGIHLTFFEAWAGAFSYTLQLYFDFSGYSDMALGIAKMFGIILPVNFYSPYKSINIIDFWRRWHITLSRFLRDYLYITLGGNRKGQFRRYLNLFFTMLLGGLWHGAGWTFVLWGGMHGVYLMVNHMWRYLIHSVFKANIYVPNFIYLFITFISVVLAWVMFRASSYDGAISMYEAMFGLNKISLQPAMIKIIGPIVDAWNINFIDFHGMFFNGVFGDVRTGMSLLVLMMFVVWKLPNTVDIFKYENPALGIERLISGKDSVIRWKPNILSAISISVFTLIAIMFVQGESEFLYFQF